MSKPKLTYFDFSGSRGQECRLALHAGGVDFEDNRISREQWKELKPTTPFGSMPLLEVAGHTFSEVNAILRLVGVKHGLHPADALEAAKHDMVMSATEHLRGAMTPSLSLEGDAKKKAREELAAGPLQTYAKGVQALIGDGPFLAGDKLSVADIKVYVLCKAFRQGAIDHVPPTVFDAHEKFVALIDAVAAHPKVVEWESR